MYKLRISICVHHLYIVINILPLQAAIAHVVHSPVGKRLRQRFECSEFESHNVRCKYSLIVNRHGAGVARGAHNSEVTRSKRVAGISSPDSHRCIKALEQLNPFSSAAEHPGS